MRVLKASLVATLLLLTLRIPPAGATFHEIQIREIFAGTSATPTAQYVELQMHSSGQRFVGNKLVRVYNAAGTLMHTETFPTAVANGANQSTILIATTQAESLFDVQADLELDTPAIPPAGGRVCFEDEDGGAFGRIDCASFGSYSGSSTDTGTPFNAAEGIPTGATMIRDINGGANPNQLDPGDDTNNSANDFEFAAPSPTNNAGSSGSAPGATLNFAATNPTVTEDEGAANIAVQRLEGYGAVVDVSYATADGTATGDDYTATSGDLSFDGDDTSRAFTVGITDDLVDEDDETVLLTLRDATGNTVLGRRLNATLTIVDDEGVPPDTTAPTSRVTKPDHGVAYRSGRLRLLRGTAEDVSGIDLVEVALRMTRTNGSCRWYTGTRFASARCNAKRWRDASGAEDWTYRLSDALPKSRRTAVRHYTLYSRATDAASNVESAFQNSRNANRFEIK